MKRLSCFVFFLIGAVLCNTAYADKSKSPEMLYYYWTGGLSRFKSEEVVIRADGSGSVTLGLRDQNKVTAISLDQNELSALKTLIISSDFFTISVSDGQMVCDDAGKTTIRVDLNGKKHELNYVYLPEIKSLVEFPHKLIEQAAAINEIESDGDLSAAEADVSPYTAGPHVLQPNALKEPLERYVHIGNDSSKLSLAIEALAYIMAPDELVGFLASELDRADPKRRAILLSVITIEPFVSNIGNRNLEALKPLYIKILKEDYGKYECLSKDHQRSLDDIVCPLLWVKAVPILLESNPVRFREHDYLKLPIIKNNGEGLRSVIPLLHSGKSDVRATAAWLVGDIFTSPPGYIAHCDGASQADKDAVLKFCRETTVPLLKDFAKGDPDEKVRQAAILSIEQISKGWRDK